MSDTAFEQDRRTPAIEGWFTTDAEPSLLGNRCTTCGTVFFPKASFFCRNPACNGAEFEETRLSRRGRIWSFTDAQYQPPPPYIPRAAEFAPFALAAVELSDEQMVVLGQIAEGYGVSDLHVGQEVELVIEDLYSDDDHDYVVYKWKPVADGSTA
ncbi:MAG: uncharacterized protein QOJ03_2491 [Frankiaceae bacterium]|nr:uncharacterized protein [Frankiaceae bacterium]